MLLFYRYAPFCKHVFVPNFAGVQTSTVKITPENEKLLVTGYEARTLKVRKLLTVCAFSLASFFVYQK